MFSPTAHLTTGDTRTHLRRRSIALSIQPFAQPHRKLLSHLPHVLPQRILLRAVLRRLKCLIQRKTRIPRHGKVAIQRQIHHRPVRLAPRHRRLHDAQQR